MTFDAPPCASHRMNTLMETFAVIGAGSWGTTLADLLARKGYGVRLWTRNPELSRLIEEGRENKPYLPGVRLPENLTATSSLADAVEGASMIVCAVPSHGIREVFKDIRSRISGEALVVSASKGIEQGTHLTCCGILEEVFPEGVHGNIAVLSGPTFAKEVSRGLPAAACAASRSGEVALRVQRIFSTPYFRVYTNPDRIGVELGGALKNVMALAAGASDGLGLGNNARAALITRGLAEMSRLGTKMGADPRTFYGLSGLGDLVLTCTGELSRNRRVGVEIGRGRSLGEILSEMRMVAEGVKTSLAVRELAAMHGIEVPITEEVCRVLYEGKSPERAVMELMTRELKGEL